MELVAHTQFVNAYIEGERMYVQNAVESDSPLVEVKPNAQTKNKLYFTQWGFIGSHKYQDHSEDRIGSTELKPSCGHLSFHNSEFCSVGFCFNAHPNLNEIIKEEWNHDYQWGAPPEGTEG